MAVTFGEQTRRYRERCGLSMGAVARSAGIDPAYVLRIERDTHWPGRSVVLRLAGAFGLTAADQDRYLFLAGHAPCRDYQTLSESYARRLADIDRALVGLGDDDLMQPVLREVV
jgi:transcriptional regulator with XRE-family HTH domain